MGYAARRNPVSRHGTPDPEKLAMIRIVRGCQYIKTPGQLDALIQIIKMRDPDIDADQVHAFLFQFCAFDPAAIEAEEKQKAAAARIKETILVDGKNADLYTQLLQRLPPDMRRAFEILHG